MEKKLKNSDRRNAILSVLENTTCHPSANWIYEKVKEQYPDVGIATVYRNLKILLEQKKVFLVEVGDGLDHYDANVHIPHDHIYCNKCGAICDVESIPINDLVENLKDDVSVESYNLILFGKCKKCKHKFAVNE